MRTTFHPLRGCDIAPEGNAVLNRRISMCGAVALGLSVFLAVPAAQAKVPASVPAPPAQDSGAAAAPTGTIHVPSDFEPRLATVLGDGGYKLVDGGLHIWTKNAGTDKV